MKKEEVMRLRPLLKDRTAVNILKLIYDSEVLQKNSYTTRLSRIAGKTGGGIAGKLRARRSARKLADYGLIAFDSVDKDYVMSITNKGREFIEVFDQLVELFAPEKKGRKQVAIKYELTNQEKRILVLSHKISKECGGEFIQLKMLVQELYPYNHAGKTSAVSRYVSRLEELGLMQRKKEGRQTFIAATEAGFRTIREQYLKGIMY